MLLGFWRNVQVFPPSALSGGSPSVRGPSRAPLRTHPPGPTESRGYLRWSSGQQWSGSHWAKTAKPTRTSQFPPSSYRLSLGSGFFRVVFCVFSLGSPFLSRGSVLQSQPCFHSWFYVPSASVVSWFFCLSCLCVFQGSSWLRTCTKTGEARGARHIPPLQPRDSLSVCVCARGSPSALDRDRDRDRDRGSKDRQPKRRRWGGANSSR